MAKKTNKQNLFAAFSEIELNREDSLELIKESDSGVNKMFKVNADIKPDIRIDQIVPNPNNIRQVSDDDEDFISLKTSIQEKGVQQPLVVKQINEEGEEPLYRVITGHRRLKALQELHEEDGNNASYTFIPCKVYDRNISAEDEAYLMVTTNLNFKGLSNIELLNSIKVVIDYYKKNNESKKSLVEKAAGDIRNISPRKIRYILDFDEKLCSLFHKAFFDDSILKFTVAQELIKKSIDEQEEMISNHPLSYQEIEKLTEKDIEELFKGTKKTKQTRGRKAGNTNSSQIITFQTDYQSIIDDISQINKSPKKISASKFDKYNSSIRIIKKQIDQIKKILEQ